MKLSLSAFVATKSALLLCFEMERASFFSFEVRYS